MPGGMQELPDRRRVVVDIVHEEHPAVLDELPECLDARLQKLDRRVPARRDPPTRSCRARSRPAGSNGAIRATRSSAGSRMMCCWLNQSSLSGLKTALPPLMPSSAKRSTSCAAREQLLVAAGRPSQERQEVDHRLRQVAEAGVLHHRGRAVPLAQALLVGAEDERHVRELRHVRPERLEQQHVLRRVGDVIVAADDMRDRHVDVVGTRPTGDRSAGRRTAGSRSLRCWRSRTRSGRAPDRRTPSARPAP